MPEARLSLPSELLRTPSVGRLGSWSWLSGDYSLRAGAPIGG